MTVDVVIAVKVGLGIVGISETGSTPEVTMDILVPAEILPATVGVVELIFPVPSVPKTCPLAPNEDGRLNVNEPTES